MNPRSALAAATAAALSLLLAACGNKGPLVLAEPASTETAPARPGAVPVTIDPEVGMPHPEAEGALRDPTSGDPLPVDPATESDDDPADDGDGDGTPPPDGGR